VTNPATPLGETPEVEICALCGHLNATDEIEGGLCSICFSEMDEGEWYSKAPDGWHAISNQMSEFEYETAHDLWCDVLEQRLIPPRDRVHIDSEWMWYVDGLPMWHGRQTGWICAETPDELLHGITIRGSWVLLWRVDDGVLRCDLKHHDVPFGGEYTVRWANPREILNEQETE
jgi:hypothetical protein